MAAVTSSWLVGSVESLALQSYTTSGGAASVAAGSYYLRHSSSSLSLLDVVAASLVASGVTGATVVMLQNRLIRIAASGTFSITWGTATTLRDLLGFTGNLSSAASYTAANVSDLLWSPSWPPTTDTIPNVDGYLIEDVRIATSRGSTSGAGVTHNVSFFGAQLMQSARWDVVPIARVRTAAGAGGTFDVFRETVLVPGLRFFHYERQTEDAASSSAVTWNDSYAHGPYVVPNPPNPRWYNRAIANADQASNLEIEMIKVSEYA